MDVFDRRRLESAAARLVSGPAAAAARHLLELGIGRMIAPRRLGPIAFQLQLGGGRRAFASRLPGLGAVEFTVDAAAGAQTITWFNLESLRGGCEPLRLAEPASTRRTAVIRTGAGGVVAALCADDSPRNSDVAFVYLH